MLLEEGFVKFKIDLNFINVLNIFIHYYNHNALLIVYVYLLLKYHDSSVLKDYINNNNKF